MSKHSTRNGRPVKIPKNLLLEKKVVNMGLRLARLDHRPFGNLVESLIAKEFERRFPDEAAKMQMLIMRGIAA